MAKLALPRLIDRPTVVRDAVTESVVNQDGTLSVHIGSTNAALPGSLAALHLHPDRVEVVLAAGVDSKVAARVNRLLDGIPGAPRVETYFRTGTMMVRTKGAPTHLPCRFTLPVPPLSQVGAAPSPVAVAPTFVAPPAPQVSEPNPPVVPQREGNGGSIRVQPAVDSGSKCGCPQGGCLFTYPDRSKANRIITDKVTKAALKAAITKHRSGSRSTVALVGPKGTGKTELVWDLAAAEGLGLFVFDGAGAASFSDWTGTTALITESGQTVTRFIPSSFIEAIRVDGPHGDEERLVLVDELNRAELSGALNALMPILSAGSLYIPETGQTVRVSRNVIFMFTMNRGAVYSATITLDAALADRVQCWVRTAYLPEDEEVQLVNQRTGLKVEDAARLVRVGRRIRDVAERGEIDDGVSTRRILVAAEMVVAGMSLRDSAEVCWANGYSDDGGAQGQRGIVMTAIEAALTETAPASEPAAQ
jgi:MoxR-like ATPase